MHETTTFIEYEETTGSVVGQVSKSTMYETSNIVVDAIAGVTIDIDNVRQKDNVNNIIGSNNMESSSNLATTIAVVGGIAMMAIVVVVMKKSRFTKYSYEQINNEEKA